MPPTYTWEHKETGEQVETYSSIAERDTPPEGVTLEDWQRIVTAPMVLRASVPDGTKRKGMEDIKKIAKLKVKHAQARSGSETRIEAAKEIKERSRLR